MRNQLMGHEELNTALREIAQEQWRARCPQERKLKRAQRAPERRKNITLAIAAATFTIGLGWYWLDWIARAGSLSAWLALIG